MNTTKGYEESLRPLSITNDNGQIRTDKGGQLYIKFHNLVYDDLPGFIEFFRALSPEEKAMIMEAAASNGWGKEFLPLMYELATGERIVDTISIHSAQAVVKATHAWVSRILKDSMVDTEASTRAIIGTHLEDDEGQGISYLDRPGEEADGV